jgi:hypothetical protein
VKIPYLNRGTIHAITTHSIEFTHVFMTTTSILTYFKASLRLSLAVIALGTLAVTVKAGSYSFQPSDPDLADLDHHNAYYWGISSSTLQNDVLAGNVITSARLTIFNIWDWRAENDILYINLLDDTKKPSSGNVTTITNENSNDNVANGNWFAPASRSNRYQGSTALTSWTDPVGGHSTNFNFVYDFTATQLSLLGNYIVDPTYNYSNGAGNMFGLGFDPECHYYNQGVCLQITTAPPHVPDEATTLWMIGGSLAALGLMRYFRRS